MNTPTEPLAHLEDAGLIEHQAGEADAYSFRHVLMQEAAYASLLKSDRRNLHRSTALALEKDHTGPADQIAALLAYHYDEADDDAKAMQYAIRAGDAEARVFAHAEALEHYTHAISLGEQLGLPSPYAYRARAQMHERSGDFDAANHDLNHALTLSQAQGDDDAEWCCLMDLGQLWASRNYERAGEFFERALDHAIAHGEPTMIAHSLNRVGNWYGNIESPEEALALHERALEIFQELNDERGLAETYDLLGMCMIIAGDIRASAAFYERAIGLFQKLDDRMGLISSQTAYGFLHRNYDTDLVVTEQPFARSAALMEQALQWARDIEYRAGESFTSAQLSVSYASQGQYTRALELAARGLELAEAIQHRQWIVSALNAVGAIHAELLDSEFARAQFERGVELALATGSGYWTRLGKGWLAIALIGQGEFARAREILDGELKDSTTIRTIAQRRLWAARVLLAIAERNGAYALELTGRLIESAANRDTHQAIPLLGYMQGRALNQLQEYERAEGVLRAALAQARSENVRPLLWRLSGALSGSLRGQARAADAEAAREASRAQMIELSRGMPENVRDPKTKVAHPLREIFLERAAQRIEQLTGGL